MRGSLKISVLTKSVVARRAKMPNHAFERSVSHRGPRLARHGG